MNKIQSITPKCDFKREIFTIHGLAHAIINDAGLSGDLLDMGAGPGRFLRQLKDRHNFKQMHGVDIRARPEDLPDDFHWYCQDLNQPFECDREFDVVTCVEVIEHLENPRATMRSIHSLLKPGGHLVLTTPNLETLRSYAALIFSGHFAGFRWEYPNHITPVIRLDLERIATECGFSDIRFYYSNRGFIPTTEMTWQRLSFGLLKGKLFSDVIAMIVRK